MTRAVFLLIGLLASTEIVLGDATVRIYPDAGGLNLRVPVIAPVQAADPARGRVIPFEKVWFRYPLAPHMTFTDRGHCTVWLRDNLRRETKYMLSLSDAQGRTLRIGVSDAVSGRRPRLEFDTGAKYPARFDLESVHIGADWTHVELSWDAGQARLHIGDVSSGPLSLPPDFQPTEIRVLSWSVDDLIVESAHAQFRLDWEQDYSAELRTTGPGAVTAQVMGTDTYVVGSDPTKRDFPLVRLLNTTAESRQVSITGTVRGEVRQTTDSFDATVELAPHSAGVWPLPIPFEQGADIYHIRVEVTGVAQQLAADHHVIYVPPRDDAIGSMRFGLHDCDVRDFGFWPDALPMTIAHKYLRWGYTHGPPWMRNSDGSWGVPEDRPAAEWNWPVEIDWELASGRELYVCLQSSPMSDWQRERPYDGHMKSFVWGEIGGFANQEKYGRFVQEAAKRYVGKIDLWEVENEPSSHYRHHVEDYVRIAETVYGALKPIIPDATIYGICGTSTFVPWMQKAFEIGVGDHLDAVSWHTYTTPNQPDQVDLAGMLAAGRAVIPDGTPVLNSETGVLVAPRDQLDHAVAPDLVAERVRDRNPAYITKSAWPGAVNDEWNAAASMVKNVTINMLAGTDGYVFFGWNPGWPRSYDSVQKRPQFSLFAIDKAGNRGPNLASLAVAVASTQLRAVDMRQPTQAIEVGNILGGLFAKAETGQLACLWTQAPTDEDLVVSASVPELELVDTFGHGRILTASKGLPDGRHLFVVPVGRSPSYLHAADGALSVLPSMIGTIVSGTDSPQSGLVDIPVTNHFDTARTILVRATDPGDLAISPQQLTKTVAPGETEAFRFTYRLPDQRRGGKRWVPFEAIGDGGEPMRFSVPLSMKATAVLAELPADLDLTDPSTIRARCQAMPMNRVEQVIVGRPAKMASLQENDYWGGVDELSAVVYAGYNTDGLFLLVDVTDPNPNVPAPWPGVGGACVEFFMDIRALDGGLHRSRYSDEVFQFVVAPPKSSDAPPTLWWPGGRDGQDAPARHSGGLTDKGYWLAIMLPWSAAGGEARRVVGFDVGVNGAWPDKPGRKTQIMLHGDADNFRDASGFGRGICLPGN